MNKKKVELQDDLPIDQMDPLDPQLNEEESSAVSTDELDENFDGREEHYDEIESAIDDEKEDASFLETSAEAVGYENRESQWNTYRVMSSYIDHEGSILDFGCGRGEFKSFFLSEYDVNLDYTGIDFNPQLIAAGQKLNSETKLLHSDWKSYEGEADWCINVGSMDLRYDADTTTSDEEYLIKTINKMYNCCNTGVAIMLASDNLQQDDGIITYSSGDLLTKILSLYGTASIDHSYSDAIFTLIIYKN